MLQLIPDGTRPNIVNIKLFRTLTSAVSVWWQTTLL